VELDAPPHPPAGVYVAGGGLIGASLFIPSWVLKVTAGGVAGLLAFFRVGQCSHQASDEGHQAAFGDKNKLCNAYSV
jgi:hypothetical protein